MKYYSEKLDKIFDSTEELAEAEKAQEEQEAEKAKLAEERKARAKKVEEAFLAYQNVKEESLKKIADAEKEYIELRDAFTRDYHAFHMTYVNDNGKKSVTLKDFVDSLFNW